MGEYREELFWYALEPYPTFTEVNGKNRSVYKAILLKHNHFILEGSHQKTSKW